MPKIKVKIGIRTRGDNNATTLPANIGLLEPVHATLRLPQSFFAVTSHAITAKMRPNMQERDAWRTNKRL